MHKLINFAALALAVLSGQAFAGGGGGEIVFDPTNYIENWATALQTAQSVMHETQMISNQLQALQYEAKNLNGFSSMIWDNTAQQLQQLANMVQTGQSLAYSMQDLDAQFQRTYNGYQPQQNYSQQYQNWSTTTLDTLRGTLDAAGMQAQDFANEESTIATLRTMGQTATGRQQALQVGLEIAGESVNQLQDLRQLVVSQTNAQNAYMAYQVQKDQAQQNASDSYLNEISTQYPQYQDKGFGTIPNF